MNNASRPTFLRNFGRAPARPAPDLADMGTAFALDEALRTRHDDSLVPGGMPRARVAVPVAPWRLWLGRKLGG